MLLPWGRTSILGQQVQLWQRLHARQIAVVYSQGDGMLLAELDRLGFPENARIPNPLPESGMFSSVRCAATWPDWEAGLTHWVIALGDQPHLRLETLQKLLSFGAAHRDKVCQPCHVGRLRHPVILPRRHFLELGGTRAGTLKDFLTNIPEDVAGCDIDDAGLDFDIDTLEDYQWALAHLFASNPSGHDARAAPPG